MMIAPATTAIAENSSGSPSRPARDCQLIGKEALKPSSEALAVAPKVTNTVEKPRTKASAEKTTLCRATAFVCHRRSAGRD